MAIRHDEAGKRFVMDLGDGSEALLVYRPMGDALEFYHTFVPESHRGQGLAEKVVAEAFRYARDHRLKVIPSCPYVSGTFLRRHKEFQNLVARR